MKKPHSHSTLYQTQFVRSKWGGNTWNDGEGEQSENDDDEIF